MTLIKKKQIKDLPQSPTGDSFYSPMAFVFGGRDDEYVETNSGTYEVVGHVPFQGTDALGGIDNIKVNIWRQLGTSVSIRIVDHNTANVIAEVTGVTSTDPFNFISMGTLSNIPTTDSILELQMLKIGGGGFARLGCLEINF